MLNPCWTILRDIRRYLRQTEVKQFHQLIVFQLRDPALVTGGNDVAGQTGFFFDHVVDALFDCALGDELVHHDILLLTDAEGAVGGLVFDGGVPPAVEVDDMVSLGQVQTDTARFERQNHKGDIRASGLKGIDDGLALFDGNAAV